MVSVIFKHQLCASFPRLLSAWASFGVLDHHVAIVRRLVIHLLHNWWMTDSELTAQESSISDCRDS
jgi:hypothetical protein